MMKKTITCAVGGLLLTTTLPLLAAAAVVPGVLNAGSVGAGGSDEAGGVVPSSAVAPVTRSLYEVAASTCPGLPWSVLAAIGTVESDNGRSPLPGVRTGQNEAGAEGPMQFEPATFDRYDHPVPPGGATPPSPYDPVDAVYAAARMLCADGGGVPARLGRAVFDYNHSGAYVAEVLAVARSYGYGSAP